VGLARIARGEVLALRENGVIESVRALGASSWYCLRYHVLRNLVPTLMMIGSLRLGSFMLEIATLSYLGLGVRPPLPTGL